jgi:hypothetical protein
MRLDIHARQIQSLDTKIETDEEFQGLQSSDRGNPSGPKQIPYLKAITLQSVSKLVDKFSDLMFIERKGLNLPESYRQLL